MAPSGQFVEAQAPVFTDSGLMDPEISSLSFGGRQEDVETLIFLDVDGVLNVGIRDPGNGALLLNDANMAYVKRMAPSMNNLPAGVRDNIVRMTAAMNRELPHGDTPYTEFACRNGCEVSEELVRRLAMIMRAAGPKAEVILSSTWRWPQYTHRVKKLEAMISENLGESFSFDKRTRLCSEHGGADRLRTVGDYMQTLGTERNTSRPLRLLILDDFCITGFGDGKMDIDGERIRSPQAAAKYICRRYCRSESTPVTCAVIHTYDSWVTPGGAPVQMGSGLTLEYISQAAAFLGQAAMSSSRCSDASTTLPDDLEGSDSSGLSEPSKERSMKDGEISKVGSIKVPTKMCSLLVSMKYLLRYKNKGEDAAKAGDMVIG